MKKYLLALSTLAVLTANPSIGFSDDLVSEKTKNRIHDLMRALKDKDLNIRMSAAEALGKIGPGAKEAVPALIDSLKDKYWNVRINAAYALGRIGPEAKEAVPALITLLKDKDEYWKVRINAARALGNIGPEAKEVVSALIASLKDENPEVRISAAYVLGDIGPEAKEVVSALIASLKDKDSEVRMYAAYALVKIGKRAKLTQPEQDSIIRALTEFSFDKNDHLIKETIQRFLEKMKKQEIESSSPTSFVHPINQGVDQEFNATSPNEQNTSGNACLYGENC